MNAVNGATDPRAAARIRRLLPRGHTLPDDAFRRRHAVLLALLWAHAVLVPLWGVTRGSSLGHSVVEAGAVAVCAAAASLVRGRSSGAVLVSLGLLTASAAIVQLSNGMIEAHFHFFVVVALLALYEDWGPFLLAIAFVALHHGVGGALAPHAVFDHPDAEAHPWRWGLVHAAYVTAAGLAAIVGWRLNEDLRDRHVGLLTEKQAALERATAAERALERSNRELARSNRELEEFASIAAHDLSAPLVTVAGFLELLEEHHAGRPDPEADELIAHALDGAHRMRRMMDDLLEFSRAGRAGLAPEPVELGATVHETLRALRAAVEASRADIVVDPLPVVSGDGRQLGRLMQNLISNALKFSGDSRPVVHVSAREIADGWEVSVTDNGIGVHPADARAIFQMFQRRSDDPRVEGTGMGLAICERIVERHGGRIWVEPAAGGGSAFRFTLPGTRVAPALHPASRTTDAAPAAAA